MIRKKISSITRFAVLTFVKIRIFISKHNVSFAYRKSLRHHLKKKSKAKPTENMPTTLSKYTWKIKEETENPLIRKLDIEKKQTVVSR